MWKSDPQIPTVWGRTTTSPGPGLAGSGRSTTSMTLAPVVSAARIDLYERADVEAVEILAQRADQAAVELEHERVAVAVLTTVREAALTAGLHGDEPALGDQVVDNDLRVARNEHPAHGRQKLVDDDVAPDVRPRARDAAGHDAPRRVLVKQRPNAFQIARAQRLEEGAYELCVRLIRRGHVPSLRREAAVDAEHRTGDEGGCVRSEEDDRLRH